MNTNQSSRSSLRVGALGLLASIAPIAAQGSTSIGNQASIDPVGIYGDYVAADHEGVHSSLPLQANLAAEKWAPVLDGVNGTALAAFQTIYFINNPSSTANLIVNIEIRNADATNITTDSVTVPPNGIERRQAFVPNTNPNTDIGLGNLRVTVDPSSDVSEFVGSTLYFANGFVADLLNPGPDVEPIEIDGFMSSMQPLQEAQPGTNLISFGPFPAYTTLTTPVDIVNGLFGFINLVNPLPVVRTVRVFVFGTTDGFLGFQDYPLAGYGALQDARAQGFARMVYTAPFDPEQEFIVYARALDDGPLVGDAVMLDLFSNDSAQGGGPGGGGLLLGEGSGADVGLGTRARMTSYMASYTPTPRLFNCELTVEGQTLTTMGVYNFGRAAATVRFQYWTRANTMLGEDVITAANPLNTLDAVVIGPGMPSSPNFPTGGVFSGTVRVFSGRADPADPLEPLLAGWTNRGAEDNDLKQMYGELLIGAGGFEQTRGFANGGNESAIISLAFDLAEGNAPGYATFLNDTGVSTGTHSYAFFRRIGTAAGTGTFPSLPAGRTSFTYEDPIINMTDFFHSGLVTVNNQAGSGISTIGGGLAARQIVEGFQGYRGPGDTVR